MNENERRKRVVTAQGLAAIALFAFAHGARAAIVTTHRDPPSQPPAVTQARAA
jgi:hypothetical protein